MPKGKQQTRSAEEILRSIVADVEAMRGPFSRSLKIGETTSNHFGGFNTIDEGTAVIEWPNLAILIDEAKTALEIK